MDTVELSLKWLLLAATLLPLVSFFFILVAYPGIGKAFGSGGWVACGAIVGSGVLSFLALAVWVGQFQPTGGLQTGNGSSPRPPASHLQVRPMSWTKLGAEEGPEGGAAAAGKSEHAIQAKRAYAGDYYELGRFGKLRLTIGYYIDGLTICMFCMVTVIASCIHFYAMGYMHDELHDVTDHEVTVGDGSHLHRPGRYFRFFQYMSLFSFSMLGLVLAGNVAMVFVFWELVGICSYFLIGFYIERKSATNAANKAFIVNRIGDFGMIVGLMAIWTGLGTFNFGDLDYNDDGKIANTAEVVEVGIFSQVRPEYPPEGHHPFELVVPEGMIRAAAAAEVARIASDHAGLMHDPVAVVQSTESQIAAEIAKWRTPQIGRDDYARQAYWLWIIAGIGVFCGCVGKSAQFPLHTWLPDAMEGPTPVSALVHSATMVAAGVYLVGRFYPFFVPEVLLVIAVVGCVTLFMAATIAITATDIKRVLAYSTVSQLGYMMLGLGVGGWLAGMLHLITHACFKSLLFLCSGSVIHAVHTNDMRQMGGLLKKMPITAGTMLVGCLAIAGLAIPFVIGLSGYYSKDAILEQAFHFMQLNGPWGAIFFWAAAGGAAITAFYMFRLWFMTFVGQPRDEHRHAHAHESPAVMTVPLVILAIFAVIAVWPTLESSPLVGLLEQARPDGTAMHGEHGEFVHTPAKLLAGMTWPNEHATHEAFSSITVPVTLLAFMTAVVGIVLAGSFYWLRLLDPEEARRQFRAVYRFLLNKWWFDELYDWVFVRPVHVLSRVAAFIDRRVIDWFIDNLAWLTSKFASVWDAITDRTIVDGSFNLFADWMYRIGLALREVQRGKIREYVMFIVLGTIVIFVVISFF